MSNTVRGEITRFDGGVIGNDRGNFNTQFSRIKHADIYSDPFRLIPNPGYTSMIPESQKDIDLTGLGVSDTTVYAAGKGLTNWFGRAWNYRVQLTVSSATTYYFIIDLATLPAGFWSNVRSDGTDIRITTTSDTNSLPYYLSDWNYGANTGKVIVKGNIESCYIYYGNPDMDSVSYDHNDIYDGWLAFYSFDGPGASDWIDDSGNNYTDAELGGDGDFTPANGKYGGGMQGGLASNDDGIDGGSAFSYTFSFYYGGTSDQFSVELTSAARLYTQVGSPTTINIDYETTSDPSTILSSSSGVITIGWNLIDVRFGGVDDIEVFVNGTKVIDQNSSVGGGFDHRDNSGIPNLSTTGNGILDMVGAYTSPFTPESIAARYANRNGNNFSVGSQQAFGDITPIYGGVQLYKKAIDASTAVAWEEVVYDSKLVKVLDRYNLPGSTILVNGGGAAFALLVNEATTFNGLSIRDLVLFGTSNSIIDNLPYEEEQFFDIGGFINRFVYPIDKEYYFNSGSDVNLINDATLTEKVFIAFAGITQLIPHSFYLAMLSNRNNRGYVEQWDLSSATPISVADLGPGLVRNGFSIDNNLIVILNEFVDKSVLAANKPAIVIKQVFGNEASTILRYEVPAAYTYNGNSWETAVSQLSERVRNAGVFYAELPANEAADQFDKGFFAIGTNEISNNFAFSQYLDTEDLGRVENIIAVGNQLVIIHDDDGSISRLATDGTYDQNTVLETVYFDGGDPELIKNFTHFDIAFEPIELGQSITVKYRQPGDSDWTLLFTCNEVGRSKYKVHEASDGSGVPDFQEMKFQVTSTGGPKAIRAIDVEAELKL